MNSQNDGGGHLTFGFTFKRVLEASLKHTLRGLHKNYILCVTAEAVFIKGAGEVFIKGLCGDTVR